MTKELKLNTLIACFAMLSVLNTGCKKAKTEDVKVINTATMTTSPVTVFTQTTANLSGEVSDDGGATVTERGFCWSTNAGPSISDSVKKVGSGKGAFNTQIGNLMLGTKYYVRAYAINSKGTSYGNEISFTTDATLALGLFYEGGYIFYLDSTKLHGMVMSENDVTTLSRWGCPIKKVVGAQSEAVGAGQSNTAAILAACTDPNTAADYCDKYVLGSYNDWFLPSVGEMSLIYQNLVSKGIGKYVSGFYWTSTQDPTSAGFARIVRFDDGGTQSAGKDNLSPIKAVRKF